MDETANLDIAADRIAWGHNAISGQWCIAPGYVYVHESVADAFIAKVQAGANTGITQYFFNADAYFRFVEDLRRRGVDTPVVPGIMPITNSSQLLRFSDACGAEVPRWVRSRLQSFGDDAAAIKDFGADVVTALCRRLLDGGAPSLHFYTLNQSVATLEVLRRLGIA